MNNIEKELIREREIEFINYANNLETLKDYTFIEFADSYEDMTDKVDALYKNNETGNLLRVQFKARYEDALKYNDVAVRCYPSGGHELENSKADLIIEFVINTKDAMFDFKGKDVLQTRIIDLRKYRNTRYRFFKSKFFNSKGYSVKDRLVYLNTANKGTMLLLSENLNEIIPGFYTKI